MSGRSLEFLNSSVTNEDSCQDDAILDENDMLARVDTAIEEPLDVNLDVKLLCGCASSRVASL